MEAPYSPNSEELPLYYGTLVICTLLYLFEVGVVVIVEYGGYCFYVQTLSCFTLLCLSFCEFCEFSMFA